MAQAYLLFAKFGSHVIVRRGTCFRLHEMHMSNTTCQVHPLAMAFVLPVSNLHAALLQVDKALRISTGRSACKPSSNGILP